MKYSVQVAFVWWLWCLCVQAQEDGMVEFRMTTRPPPMGKSGSELCPGLSSSFEDCIMIRSWKDLRDAADQGGRQILCPFRLETSDLTEEASDFFPGNRRNSTNVVPKTLAIRIRQPLQLVCQIVGLCILEGPGTHMSFNSKSSSSDNAKVLIQGFTFLSATDSALKFLSPRSTTLQRICHCQFLRNRALGAVGGAVKVASGMNVAIVHSTFESNEAREAGALFSRGKLLVYDSIFLDNASKRGGAIVSFDKGTLKLEGCKFQSNVARIGPAVYVKAAGFTDLGRNTYSGVRGKCNGVLIGKTETCSAFPRDPSDDAEDAATDLNESNDTNNNNSGGGNSAGNSPGFSLPRNVAATCSRPPKRLSSSLQLPPGYFNFNEEDAAFGPRHWAWVDITENDWTKHSGLAGMRNFCADTGLQSPIDLQQGSETVECEAFHQIRTGTVKVPISDKGIAFSITPTQLRIDFLVKTKFKPRADIPDGFGKVPAKHVQVSIPSQHTINGVRYDGEYTVAHVQKKKNRVIMISSLIDASGWEPNPDFEIMLQEWEKVTVCGIDRQPRGYSARAATFGNNKERNATVHYLRHRRRAQQEQGDGEENGGNANGNNKTKKNKKKKMEPPRWDIYSSRLIPSIYFHAYKGSLTEPPCFPNVHWRISDKVMTMSRSQHQRMKILLTRGPCTPWQDGLGDCFARPLQDFGPTREYWRCERIDFLSDCVLKAKHCRESLDA